MIAARDLLAIDLRGDVNDKQQRQLYDGHQKGEDKANLIATRPLKPEAVKRLKVLAVTGSLSG